MLKKKVVDLYYDMDLPSFSLFNLIQPLPTHNHYSMTEFVEIGSVLFVKFHQFPSHPNAASWVARVLCNS